MRPDRPSGYSPLGAAPVLNDWQTANPLLVIRSGIWRYALINDRPQRHRKIAYFLWEAARSHSQTYSRREFSAKAIRANSEI